MTPAQPRLVVFLARSSPCAVVLRRGPSKHVLLVRWDLRTDTFEEGQWLVGRVDNELCDLSPSGRLFLYCASNYAPRCDDDSGERHDSWMAVSQPPWWTALSLWPLNGLRQGLAVWFEAEDTITMQRRGAVPLTPARGREPPPWFRVRTVDAPPWRRPQAPPILRRPGGEDFEVCAGETPALRRLRDGHSVLIGGEWAGWDRNGDLLFAHAGVLHRLRDLYTERADFGLGAATVLADLRDRRFEPRRAPAEYTRWSRLRARH